jgi:hypothetical protein
MPKKHGISSLESYQDNGDFNSFKITPAIPKGKSIKILFIGNSITHHNPAPEIGWVNNCGMAAENLNLDYVHLLGKYLNIESTEILILNCAEFERIPILLSESINNIKKILNENEVSSVVIQLGDNITNEDQLTTFAKNMNFLLKEIKLTTNNISMISTWWHSSVKDSVILKLCQAYESRYIDISDLYDSPMNIDRIKKDYVNSGVDNHPKSWGMEQIANRVLKFIK